MTVKNQHYVPCFYLRNFCSDQAHLYVYDKKVKKSFPASVEGVANEKYFYDLSEDQELKLGAKQFIEKFFIPLEGKVAETVRGIIKRLPFDDFKLTVDEIIQLSEYLYYQYVRTKEHREFSIKFARTMTKKLCDFHLQQKFPNEKNFDYKINIDEPLAHAKDILNTKRLKECMATFQDRNWIIGENRTKIPFYTSDHPFVKIAHKKGSDLKSYAGLKSEGIEIVFPISSKYIIVLLEKSFFKQYEGSHQSKTFFDTEDHVRFYNWLQIKDSYRQIFCEIDSFQPLVNETLKLSSRFFDIDKNKVKMSLNPTTEGQLIHNQLVDISIFSDDVLGRSFFK